ncbi:unnamed protein product, partial [Dovyalis caffra]
DQAVKSEQIASSTGYSSEKELGINLVQLQLFGVPASKPVIFHESHGLTHVDVEERENTIIVPAFIIMGMLRPHGLVLAKKFDKPKTFAR